MSLLKKYILFMIGTAIQSAGIALVVKGLLGTSPISSIPYVLSLAMPYTFGETTFVVNMLLVLGQILLLRHKFHKVQFLQVPITFFFAYMIDVFMAVFAFVEPTLYPYKILTLLLGAAGVSMGVALQVIANVLMLPGEGIVYAISQTFSKDFGKVKTVFDCTLAISAILISVIFMGDIEGVREGTIISALVTGSIARFFIHRLSYVDETGQLVFSLSFQKSIC